ncbi:MAG: hypothetical protein KH421_12395, partial [Akkermansia muciniphila]|nr:hypothetical protein [Akkermansia muciniphila]
FELLLCHGTVCVVGKIRDLILQLSKSSIYSTKPGDVRSFPITWLNGDIFSQAQAQIMGLGEFSGAAKI